MNIPSRVNPFGYDNSIPPGYTRAEFLEGTGVQAIKVPAIIDTSVTVVACAFSLEHIYYNQHPWGINSVIGEGNYRTGVRIVGGDQSTGDYTLRFIRPSTSWWTIAISSAKRGEKHNVVVDYSQNKIYWDGDLKTEFSKSELVFSGDCGVFGHFHNVEEPVYTDKLRGCISYFSISANGEKQCDIVPTLDATGTPCMYDLMTNKPFYNSGTGQFIVGLTMGQALNLAYLPAPTTLNTLTVSLPLEATLVLYNQPVESALTTAAEKGWNIAVQYRDKFDDEAIRDKYAHCTSMDDMLAVNPDYRNDLTEDGAWIYPLTNMTEFPTATPFFFEGSPMRKIDIELPKVVNGDFILASADKLEEARVIMPAAVRINRLLYNVPVKKFYIEAPLATNNGFAFYTCPNVEEITEENFKTGNNTAAVFLRGRVKRFAA